MKLMIKKIELDKILDILSSGGFLLTHYEKGSVAAEHDAIRVSNKLLGNKVSNEIIENIISDSIDKDVGYVFAIILLKHKENKDLQEVHDLAQLIYNVVGVNKHDIGYIINKENFNKYARDKNNKIFFYLGLKYFSFFLIVCYFIYLVIT